MKRRVSLVILIVCPVIIATGAWFVQAGDLNPPSGPIKPTMHSLSELYAMVDSIDQRLLNGGINNGGGCAELLDPLFAGASPEAFDMYMRVDGVTGESRDPDHIDWIELMAVAQNVLHEKSAPDYSSFRVLAHTDLSLVSMMMLASTGSRIDEVFIDFVQADEQRKSFLTIKLQDVRTRSFTPFYQSGGYIVEFDFVRTTVEFTSPVSGEKREMCWDIENNSFCG